MMPHGVPSGGDWALERYGAVFLHNTEKTTVDTCKVGALLVVLVLVLVLGLLLRVLRAVAVMVAVVVVAATAAAAAAAAGVRVCMPKRPLRPNRLSAPDKSLFLCSVSIVARLLLAQPSQPLKVWRASGNGIMLSAYNQNATISQSEFVWMGGSAIAAWGYTDEITDGGIHGVDGTTGDFPRCVCACICMPASVGVCVRARARVCAFVCVGAHVSVGVRACFHQPDVCRRHGLGAWHMRRDTTSMTVVNRHSQQVHASG
jgi:hypothetical protein